MSVPAWINIKIELNDLALDADHDGRTGDATYARMAIERIEKLESANTELERRNQEMNREISGLRRSYFEERAKVVRMEKGGR